MSLLTVSHYLSGDHEFDLVIFDEASQVPPWDAINCIYRGDQVVVAGDNKQLPPSSFFELASADTEDQEDDGYAEEVMESILDSCEAILPARSGCAGTTEADTRTSSPSQIITSTTTALLLSHRPCDNPISLVFI